MLHDPLTYRRVFCFVDWGFGSIRVLMNLIYVVAFLTSYRLKRLGGPRVLHLGSQTEGLLNHFHFIDLFFLEKDRNISGVQICVKCFLQGGNKAEHFSGLQSDGSSHSRVRSTHCWHDWAATEKPGSKASGQTRLQRKEPEVTSGLV